MSEATYLLQRYSDDGKSTLGLLLLAAAPRPQFRCYTLEDEYRATKVPGETRIPAGRYELRLRQALTPMTQRYRARYPWFLWHVEITNVPGFSHVYLHVGNTDRDTDACVLLGDTVNNNRTEEGFIGKSVPAYERWYREAQAFLVSGYTVHLDVRDESALDRRRAP